MEVISATRERPRVEQHYFGPGEAAIYLGVSRKYLSNLRAQGRGPRFYRPGGGNARYARSDLDAWIRSHPSGGEQPATIVAPAG